MTGSPEDTQQSATDVVPDAGGLGVFGETSPRIRTLTERADFLAAARGPRQATPGFVLQARARPAPAGPEIRVGFTCSKKVGNAVARNRSKRRLRALARQVLPQAGRPGWDYVLIGRAGGTAEAEFAGMCTDLQRALERLHAKAPA